MSLQDLTKKIIDEAEVQAKNITSASGEEIAKLKKATDAELATLSASHEASLKQTLSLNKERILASAGQEVRSFHDREKRAILDEVYAKALTKLSEANEDTLEKIFSSHVSAVKNETGTTHVAIDHEKAVKKLAKKFDAKFTIKPDKNIPSGFIFVGNTTEYDATFPTLIARAKESIEPEIAEILFS